MRSLKNNSFSVGAVSIDSSSCCCCCCCSEAINPLCNSFTVTKQLTMDGQLRSSTSMTSVELQRLNTDGVHHDVSRNCDDMVSPSRVREQEPLIQLDGEEYRSAMPKEDKNQSTISCWKCKYSWRLFLPVACCCRSSQLPNEENSGFLEITSVSWATDIFIKGFKKTLTSEDLGELSRTLTAKVSKDKLIKVYAEESSKRNESDVSLTRVFWKLVRTKLLLATLLLMVYLTVEFSKAAFILKNLLIYIEKPYGTVWDGLKWALLLGFFGLSRSVLMSSVFYLQLRSGIAARAAALSFIYHKLSRLKSVGNKSVGELVNLCANDSQRIFECCQFCTFLFGAPFLTILMSVYMYIMFGPSSLIGMAVMIMFLPIQAIIGRMIGRFRAKVIGHTDRRVKMINEILTCIKLIKMYGWEKSFAKVVRDIRSKEKKLLVKLLFMQAINMSMALLLPSIAPVATFAAHIAMGKNLTVSDAFTIIVMFNIFPPNIALLPIAVRGISEARNAMKRIKSLLQLDDFVPYDEVPSDASMSLVMTNCHFSWVEVADEIRSKVPKQRPKEENVKDADVANGKSHQGNSADASKDIRVEFKKTKGKAKVTNGALSVESQLIPTLFDINLSMKKGSLFGVCGSVGSGKSSLIQAVLAQMHLTNGSVQVVKHIAYVPQQAWIINDTVRNNITFGKSYDEDLFEECCKACALDKDIKGFESGDLTEIGERGINLSGGQKQRISLARALYADADFYLLDDPLSAVDAHVGKYIFTNYIKERLRGKTCIFVTHQLQYLKDCDEVIMMSNGRIEEMGTYLELMNAQKDFYALINEFTEEGEDDEPNEKSITELDKVEVKIPVKSNHESCKSTVKTRRTSISSSISSEVNSAYDSDEYPDTKDDEEEKIRKGKIIAKEESSVGSVSWKVYCALMKAGGGYIISSLAVLMQMSVLAIIVFVEWWLSNWLDRASKPVAYQNGTRILTLSEHPDSPFFMTIYGAVGSSMFLAQMISSMIFTFLFINASTNLHNNVLDSILKCPMKFYDTTPTGRIINRFSRDVDEIDGRLSWTVEAFIRNGTRILTALAFVAVIFPWLLIGFVPLSAIFVALFMLFRRTSREVKRIDNVTRSPIFSHVTATVQGLPVLRAFSKTDHFRRMFESYVDKNSLPLYLFFLSGRWFSVRLDLLCVILSTATAIFAVATKGSIAPAFAGLAIMYSLRITGLFQFTCRLAAETEARFTSVERMSHYSTELEHEGPFETEKKLTAWPSNGKIDFINVNLRYRPSLPLVLKDVSFTINAMEKIGIAGRTGAGKSSLAVALFRLGEVDDGKILIDDQDTSSIGLTQLRSRLSVIPQDPVLFIGTLRYNLDPFGQHTDEKLWLALEKAYMKDAIASLPLKLETLVVENGENFSVGERQLICMARALLQESKILLLDEATAAIDSATDAKIQITIRDSFKDCTVLTIAHRLNTIMECDRVLVMDDGKIAEFDKPSSLLSNEDSLFAKMAKTAKLST